MSKTLCLHNGRIYGPQGLQDESAIVIENGFIRYVGDENGIRSFINGEIEMIDVGGRIVFPGFIDSHIHLTEWSRQREYIPLGEFNSLESVLEHIRSEAEGRSWVLGGGWNQNNWRENRFPHRRDLDILEPGVKAIFYSKDLHSAWVNEAVIEKFNFEDVLKMMQKGFVKRDPDGRLNGIIREEAMEVLLEPLLIDHLAPVFSDPISDFKEFYKHGITSVHSMEHMEHYRKYREMYQYEHHRGLRLGMYIYHSDSEKVYEQNLRFGSGGDWLRFYGIKLFVDGALGSQTAWMREPYENAEQTGKKQMNSKKPSFERSHTAAL